MNTKIFHRCLTPVNICYTLTICTMFLPWFTYDADIMGYRFGFVFLGWFFVQFIVLAVYLSHRFQSSWLIIAAEFCAVANLAAMVMAFGRWQEVCNIIGGWHFEDGFYTAQPGFWISAVIFVLFFVLLQVDIIKQRKNA